MRRPSVRQLQEDLALSVLRGTAAYEILELLSEHRLEESWAVFAGVQRHEIREAAVVDRRPRPRVAGKSHSRQRRGGAKHPVEVFRYLEAGKRRTFFSWDQCHGAPDG